MYKYLLSCKQKRLYFELGRTLVFEVRIFVVKTDIATLEDDVLPKVLTGFCTSHKTSFDRRIYSTIRVLRDLVADERFSWFCILASQTASTKH